MSKQPPSEIEWAHVRRLWETTPKMGFGDVGRLLGVSRQAAAKRASREGWKKQADLSEIARKAHTEADKSSAEAAEQAAALTKALKAARTDESVRADVREAVAQVSEAGRKAAVERADQTAVDLRAKLLDSHRKEWMAVRSIVWDAIQRKDFERAKLGKITSEAMRLIQDGERKAWGLDIEEKDKAGSGEPTKLIIERREMKL